MLATILCHNVAGRVSLEILFAFLVRVGPIGGQPPVAVCTIRPSSRALYTLHRVHYPLLIACTIHPSLVPTPNHCPPGLQVPRAGYGHRWRST